jgi:hypothetical protein
LRARHIEVHGRIAEGSVTNKPVIEVALQLDQALSPALHPAVAQPINATATARLRGLNDFSPKPWAARFREIQAADGRIDITQVRIKQTLPPVRVHCRSIVTATSKVAAHYMAGLEQFLAAIGAQQKIQASPNIDKLAGPRPPTGLAMLVRQQAAQIFRLVTMLGEQTTLEGKRGDLASALH